MEISLPNELHPDFPNYVWTQITGLRQLDDQSRRIDSEYSFARSYGEKLFTFSNQSFENTTLHGLEVYKMAASAELRDLGLLKIDMYIFSEPGEFAVGHDTIVVVPGSVKLNVELSNWTWCGPGPSDASNCGSNVASSFLELDMYLRAVDRSDVAMDIHRCGMSTDLGLSRAVMPRTYSEDGGMSWKEMPVGFPVAHGTTSKNNAFTIRIPKFTEKVIFQQILTAKSDYSVTVCTDMENSKDMDDSNPERGWPDDVSTSTSSQFLSVESTEDSAMMTLKWVPIAIGLLHMVQ